MTISSRKAEAETCWSLVSVSCNGPERAASVLIMAVTAALAWVRYWSRGAVDWAA
ncbi:hypothetical protein D3C80_1958970 [compost metagenome]